MSTACESICRDRIVVYIGNIASVHVATQLTSSAERYQTGVARTVSTNGHRNCLIEASNGKDILENDVHIA